MFFRERRQLVIFAATAVLIGGFIALRYLPLRDRIRTLKQTKAAEVLSVSKGQMHSRQIPVLEQQLQQTSKQIGDFEAKIPQQRDLGVFLRKIADLMDDNNLKEQQVTPGEQVEAPEMNCIPVTMQCKGKLADLHEFFRQLQALDRVIRIKQVKLINDAEFSGELAMETSAVIYYGAKLTRG